MTNIIILVVMILFFYFMILRPQKKRQNEHKEMLDNIKLSDEVVTIGGVHGKVVKIEDDKITILTGRNRETKLVFLKVAVSNKK